MCADKVGSYDAVIVGSGVSGALIAKILGQAKKKVLLLEAGEKLPPNVNGYMDRFLMTTAKVPESPYPPDLFTGNKLTDPATVNGGRATVLSLGANGKFGDWQDPKQSYFIQKGPLPFASTYERINGGTVRHWLGTSLRFVPRDFEMKNYVGRFPNRPISCSALERMYGDAQKEIGLPPAAAAHNTLPLPPSSPH